MGGRTKSRRIQKKPAQIKLRTVFDCAVCGFKDCIIIKINKGYRLAKLECDRCETNFKLKVKRLDEPIDVYHEWLNKLRSKSIAPFPGRLEDYYDEEESENNDVEQLLKNSKKASKNTRKKVKKNIEEENEPEQSISEQESQQSEPEEPLSDDSLAKKQKVEDIDDVEDDEEVEDSDDESYNIKKTCRKLKKQR